MKTYKELKKFCDEKIKSYPDLEKKYKKEIIYAKRFYNNNINLYQLLVDNINKKKISSRYIIPFLLGITDEVIDEEWKYKFINSGSSGGIDIDLDFDPIGKQKIQEYLLDKYGEDKVFHVGTFNRLGIKAAAKDLLRVYNIDYTEGNKFTKAINTELSWKDNLYNIKENNPDIYQFYINHKSILDLTPYFVNKIRQSGKHAGGVIILDDSVYNRIPVDRVTGEVVTAFPESSQEQVLDEIGVIKFDILAITILDVIRNTINMIDEKMFLIDEDGIRKIVPQSYLDKEIETL